MAKPAMPGAGIFAPKTTAAESKHQITNNVARGIMDAEAKAREAKTAKLRELRLKAEAEAPPPPPAKPKRAATAAKKAK